MPRPKSAPPAQEMAHVGFESDAQSDEPVLHRKHHAGDASAAGTGKGGDSGSNSGSGSTETLRLQIQIGRLCTRKLPAQHGDTEHGNASSSPSADSALHPPPFTADQTGPRCTSTTRPTARTPTSSAGAAAGDPDRPC